MLGSRFERFFASWRIFEEISMPTRSPVVLATFSKRSPVPQPKSKTNSFPPGLALFRAASIFAFCSSAYWMSYTGAS